MKLILYGQYPRSEELVHATRAFERKRISKHELEACYVEEENRFEALQKNFKWKSSGLFRINSLIAPFQELITGAKCEPLKRFFETNTFWRVLEHQGTFRLKSNIDAWRDLHYTKDVATLPFLFTFKRFSLGLSTTECAKSLKAAALSLQERGHGVIVFFEPSLGFEPIDPEDFRIAKDLVETVRGEVPVIVATTFWSIKEQKDALFSLNADGYGIDFFQNTVEGVLSGFPNDKILISGVIRTDSTLIDDRTSLTRFLKKAENFVSKDKIFITTSQMAELLPEHVLHQKIEEISTWT